MIMNDGNRACVGREGDVKLFIDNIVEPSPSDAGSPEGAGVCACAGKSYKGPPLPSTQFNICNNSVNLEEQWILN